MTRKNRTYNVTFSADVDGTDARVTVYGVEGRNRKQAISRARRNHPVNMLPADELNRAEVTTEIVHAD